MKIEERHRLAMQAALLDGQPGAQAFQAWQALVPLDHVDHDEFRILPLIYLRAEERGCRAPEMGRLKGVYRQVWVRNTLLLQTCAEVVRTLRSAAIPTLLLKGIAMFARWTGTAGPRSMRDLDVLVHRSEVRRATRLLVEQGWRDTGFLVEKATEAELDWWPALTLTRDGSELDLHWRALSHNTAPDHVATFWARSLPHEVMGEATRVLCPEDQIYHSLMHGARWTNGARLDWMVDLGTLLRACPDGLDWGRILAHAERDRSLPVLAHQIRQFEAVLGVKVPISDTLERRRGSLLDRHVFRRFGEPHFQPRRSELTLVNLHAALVRGPGRSRFGALVDFVCRQWDLERPADILPEVLFRSLGRPNLARPVLARSGRLRPDRVSSLPSIGAPSPLSDPERSPFLSGWSGPEPGGRWTGAAESVLAFRDDTGQHGDLLVVLRATPFLAPRHRRRRIAVFANARHCGDWRFEGEAMAQQTLAFTVPQAVRRLRPGVLSLAVAVRHPVRPMRMSGSIDVRRLGLFLTAISIGHPELADPFAHPIEFASGRNGDLLISGWSHPEVHGRWTDGPQATIALQWPSGHEGEIDVVLVGRTLPGPVQPDKRLAVLVDGEPRRFSKQEFGPGEGMIATFRTWPARTDRGFGLRFDLSILQPASPASLGLSSDTRRLGFYLERVELRRQGNSGS